MPFDGNEFSGTLSPTPALPASVFGKPASAAPAPTQTAPTRPEGWLATLTAFWRRPARGFLPRHTQDLPEIGAADLLRQARAVIDDEGRWAQGRYSTLDGRHCAVGALRAVTRDVNTRRAGKRAHAVLRGVALESGFGSVEQMNDRWSHAEVMRAFDRAIVAAERGSPAYF